MDKVPSKAGQATCHLQMPGVTFFALLTLKYGMFAHALCLVSCCAAPKRLKNVQGPLAALNPSFEEVRPSLAFMLGFQRSDTSSA